MGEALDHRSRDDGWIRWRSPHSLEGDRLIGKVDATADRKASTLIVHAVHEDVSFTRAMSADVDAELDALAQWLGLGRVHRA